MQGFKGLALLLVLLLHGLCAAWADAGESSVPPHCKDFQWSFDTAFLGSRQEAKAGNVTYAYHRFGPLSAPQQMAEPLVLINGFSHDMYDWHPQVLEQLAAEREVIIFDNIGIGYTAVQGGVANANLSIPFMADSTAVLLETLGLTNPSVLGYSMGGMIALALATRHGAQLSAIIVYNSCGGGAACFVKPDLPEALPKLTSDFKGYVTKHPGYMFAHGREDPGLCVWLAANEALNTRYNRKPADAEGAAAQSGALARYYEGHGGIYEGLPKLQNKVLYLHGVADWVVPVNSAYASAARTPAADVVVFDEAGHALMYSKPEEMASTVQQFLQRAKPVSAEALKYVSYGVPLEVAGNTNAEAPSDAMQSPANTCQATEGQGSSALKEAMGHVAVNSK